MAGEIDFRLLSPTGPADIAQSYGRGQQEAQANLLAQQQLQSAQNQNALAKYQIDAARMQNEQQNALNAKYATGAFDPMSNESHLKELYGMGAPGRAQAGEILKFRADQRKAEESAFNVAAKRHDVYKQEMGVLATEPNLTKDMVVSTFDNLVANGLMPQATRDAMVAKLPDDSAALRASALQDAKAGLKGKELLTAFLPEPMIAGGDIINKNPLAPGGVGKVLGRVAMSEAQIAQNKVAQRNADIAAGRLAVEQKRLAQDATGVVYPEDGNGNIVALPSKLKAGEVPTGRMVVAPGGGFQPMQAKPSEAVGKEQMSINQQKSIVQGALKAISETPDAFGYTTGMMPESVRGRMASPEENTNRSYLFNVVSGVIKERAGTAQSAAEAQTLARFLPTETDNADIIKSKLEGFDKYLTDKEKGTSKKRSGPTTPTLAPMDQQALQWANSNPADPRAAAIKQRLGQ